MIIGGINSYRRSFNESVTSVSLILMPWQLLATVDWILGSGTTQF